MKIWPIEPYFRRRLKLLVARFSRRDDRDRETPTRSRVQKTMTETEQEEMNDEQNG